MSIEEIIALFHREKASEYTLKSVRLDEDDSRWILYVTVAQIKYVIKIAANGFTTAERIRGWVDMIAEYQKMGYYSPAVLKSLRGNYAETIQFNEKGCVVWEEEYAKYNLRDSLDKAVYTRADGIYVYHDEVLAFIAKIAEKHYSNFPYPSGWVRFEPFGADETTDEVSECVEAFGELVNEKAPNFLSRWDHIRSLFEENKQKLREIYGNLPTSVFQSDEAGNNLILDDNGHFLGVIDYNLAGKDVVINRFLSAILFGYSYHQKKAADPHLLPELNSETQNSVIEIVLDSLRKLRRYYTFNEMEAQAAPLLFKYISCIEYTQIEALEKYAHDHDKLQQLFDFMEHELLRDDIDFRGAMLD